MTQHQRQQASVFATVAMIGTLIGGVGGTILGAYQFGDDRYTRIAETEKIKKDIEHLGEMKNEIKSLTESMKRIEIRLGSGASVPTSSPLASRNPHGNDPTP